MKTKSTLVLAALLSLTVVVPVSAQPSDDEWCSGFVQYLDTETRLNLKGEVVDLLHDGCMGYLAQNNPAEVVMTVDDTGSGETHTITGDFYYSGEYFPDNSGDKCIGQSTTIYVGLQSGTQVILTDGSGATAGVGRLAEAPDSGKEQIPGTTAALCHFTFEMTGVRPADFYEVTVGRVPGPTYSYSDLETSDWHITLQ